MTRIKICGLLEASHAIAAAKAGADFIGFVFAPSRRRIEPTVAAEIIRAISTLKTRPLSIGVFANMPSREVNMTANACGLDRVQLSGGEDLEYCREIERPITKVFHVRETTGVDQVTRGIEDAMQALRGQDIIFMLDTGAENASGGTGKTFDWAIARAVSNRYPIIAAGGLTPENVGVLINKSRPWGVDVSSGVESAGVKDASKIRLFIEAVRKADRLCADLVADNKIQD